MSSIPNPQNPYVDPIPQKTTVALINLVVVRFSDFLNKFYANTEEKLLQLEKRIDTIDTVLLLLEKKLDSVPAEFYNARPVQNYNQDVAPSDAQQAAAEQAIDPENDPAREDYERFIKMHKMGIPLQALRNKMQAEGLDPAGIERYIEIDPADRTVPASVSLPRPQPPQNVQQNVPQNAQPQNPEPQAEEPAPAADDEEREQYAKFIKLHKMGIPLQALKLKMNAEGLDPDGIDKYLPVE